MTFEIWDTKRSAQKQPKFPNLLLLGSALQRAASSSENGLAYSSCSAVPASKQNHFVYYRPLYQGWNFPCGVISRKLLLIPACSLELLKPSAPPAKVS